MNQIMPKILNDIKVDLADEFDKNFERKAFFDKPWKGPQVPRQGLAADAVGCSVIHILRIYQKLSRRNRRIFGRFRRDIR